MKTKTKLWNRGLFADGFKQLKWIGIAGLIIAVAFALIMQITGLEVLVNLGNLIYILMVPVMMITLFGFLNKRRGSDFYHGCPQKRITVYLSYLSAVFAWACLVIVVYQAVSLASAALFASGLNSEQGMAITVLAGRASGNSDLIWQSILLRLAGTVLVMGGMALAMSMTGRTFTNVIAFLVIMLVPRVILSILVSSYYDMLSVIPVGKGIYSLINPAYQLYFSSLGGSVFTFSLVVDLYMSGAELYTGFAVPVVYSSILGILYLAAGGVLFCRRKSEAAEQAVAYKGFHSTLRMAVALVCTLVGTVKLADYLLHTEKPEGQLAGILFWFVLGVAVCFVYELICTKQLKSAVKCLVQLPILAALNIVVFLPFFLSGKAVIDHVPAADKIQSVSVQGMVTDMENALPEAAQAIREIELDDKEVTSVIGKELPQQMALFKRNKQQYEEMIGGFYETAYGSPLIKIKTDTETQTRYVGLTQEECSTVRELLVKKADTISAGDSIKMPEYKKENQEKYGIDYGHGITSFHCGACGYDFSEVELAKLYETLCQEVEEKEPPLSFYLGSAFNTYGVVDFLEISSDDGTFDFPITVSMPKTLKKLADMGNERRKDFDLDWFVNYIQTKSPAESASLSYILYLPDQKNPKDCLKAGQYDWGEGDLYYDSGYSGNTLDNGDLQELERLLSSHKETELDPEQSMFFLVTKNIDGQPTRGHWYNLTYEELKSLKQIINCGSNFHRNSFQY